MDNIFTARGLFSGSLLEEVGIGLFVLWSDMYIWKYG